MNYIINIDRLSEVIKSYLDLVLDEEMVCEYDIDYDEQMDRIVVNIFFKKIGSSIKIRKVVEETVISKIKEFFGFVPLVYNHYGNC